MTGPRDVLGAWGQQLLDEEVGPALAAAGVLAAAWGTVREQVDGPVPPDVTALLAALVGTAPSAALPWASPFHRPGWRELETGPLAASALAAAWATVAAGLQGPVRFAVDERSLQRTRETWDLRWLVATLSGPTVADGASALLDTGPSTHVPNWDWPLRVGAPEHDDELLAELDEAAVHGDWMAAALRPVRLGHRAHTAAMLVLEGPPDRWGPWLDEQRPQGEVAIAFVPDAADLEPAIDRLGRLGGHPVTAALVTTYPRGTLGHMLWDLTHDVALDLALRLVVGGDAPEYLVRGPAATVERLRMRASVAATVRDLREAAALPEMAFAVDDAPSVDDLTPGAPRIAVPRIDVPRDAGAGADLAHAADDLRPVLDQEAFHREADGAVPLSQVSDGTRAAREDAGPVRVVQATVADEGGRRLSSFVAAATHRVTVFVGPPEAGTVRAPAAFPDDALPPADEHRLTVLLAAPHLDEVLRAEIVLPRVGRSTDATFDVPVPVDATRLRLRLAVLHGGRVLQSWALVGPVTPDGEAVPDASLALTLEAAPRLRTTDLHRRRRFDLAVVANHDDEHTPGGLAVAGDLARKLTFARAGADDAITDIRNVIEQAIKRTGDDRPGAIGDAATTEFLTALANRGVALREAVEVTPDALVDDSVTLRLQLVSATPDAWLPLELAYSYDAPGASATMCAPGVALLDVAAPGPCPGPHGEGVVCPIGFWGLRHVLERRIHEETGLLEEVGWRPMSEPAEGRDEVVLRGPVLFGATDKVDQVVSDTRARALAAIGGAGGSGVRSAEDWAAWEAGVAAAPPADVLALLAHTLNDPVLGPALEIGSGQHLGATMIKEKHVTGGTDRHVTALLLGCRTEEAEIPLNQYTARFRRRGATFVVGTLAKVQGRDAGPLATALTARLLDPTRPAMTLGELFVGVRREAVRDLGAIGLVLVAYGDADWVVGPGGSD